MGSDRDNAEYLVLRNNGTYTLLSRSDTANDMEVEPYNEIKASGTWIIRNDHVLLYIDKDLGNPYEMLKISGNRDYSGLRPTMGKGRHLDEIYRHSNEYEILRTGREKIGFHWITKSIDVD
jgi:hypothetical protein